jgi:hypothetical protein
MRFATSSASNDRPYDPYMLRDSFLAIRSAGEAAEFFGVAGYFHDFNVRDGESVHERMSWTRIQDWQKIIRGVLRYGWLSDKPLMKNGELVGVDYDAPAELLPTLHTASQAEGSWLSGIPRGFFIFPELENKATDRPVLRATIMVHSVLEAILATIYVDSLNGVQRELCGFPDCNTLYEITSNHVRHYCSQACAHKASMRARRKKAKEARTEVSPKPAKLTNGKR